MYSFHSICSDCHHRFKCVLNPSNYMITSCSEYENVRTFYDIYQQNPLSKKMNENLGICTTCDLKKECILRSENEIRFHCEEYK
jgi:hypothetical protein